MKNMTFRLISFLFLLPFLTFAQDSAEIKHSLFIAGHDFTGIIGEEGEVIWQAEKAHARDGYVLKNGNILICYANEVIEYNKKNKIVFNYERAEKSMELGTAVRLKNGNTLITESGKNPRLLEVSKKGEIVKNVPLQPETDNTHMQTRMARKLKNGNYLVPHLLAFKVKEYTPDGNVVDIFETDMDDLGGREAENWPFTAIRLKNGNTLTTLTHGNKVVEMDSEGKVVWEVNNENVEGSPFADPCGAQRLPNGNTVIASYGAKKGIRLFEIDREKNIVWTMSNYNVHHFQILTTNGKRVKGVPMK
ncbi:beta-propeller domain-containing protein [Portibacter lacus]|uniref:Arylsulfotransferase (ASST) n=1 Tax=Portibacter lacus TaxID=1099794 RepID=A0AA37SQ66_9BACT|nr:hypothetical protein [Portibacter lacus]GLR18017.1 hypothetical protein GCM10007940_26320 [Portibacter lacus]